MTELPTLRPSATEVLISGVSALHLVTFTIVVFLGLTGRLRPPATVRLCCLAALLPLVGPLLVLSRHRRARLRD